jgi:hypothetical protein
MSDEPSHLLLTHYTPAEIWKIAEDSVLDAAKAVSGVRPSLLTPVNRYLSDKTGVIKYYGKLQDILRNEHGLLLDLLNDPLKSVDDTLAASFMDLVLALEARLKSQDKA